MFWKKKQGTKKLFVHETDERRDSFRIQPAEDKPIFVKIEDAEICVANISASGMALKNNNFIEENLYNASFRLPGIDSSASVKLEIVEINQGGICHCNFKDISEEATESVYLYVLTRQIEELNAKKKQE